MRVMDFMVTPVAAVGSAVTAVVYVNFSARVMPRLNALPTSGAVSTMQHFNRVAVQAPFMAAFFGAAAASACIVASRWWPRQHDAVGTISAVGAGLYLVGFALTVVYHVPRNEQLARETAGSASADRYWATYAREWTAANTLRAVLSTSAAVTLGGAVAWRVVPG